MGAPVMLISTSPERTPSLASRAGRHRLAFDQTVPRALVHRAGVAEVFLTDGCRLDGDRALIAAQWPRNHALYQPDAVGCSDPMLLVETVRQAALYAAHRFHAVPLAHRFIFCDLDFRVVDPAPLRVAGAPLRVVLDGRFQLEGNRSAKRLGARFDAVVEVEGRPCARASVRLLAVGDQLYDVLRHRAGAPVADGRVPAAAVTSASAAEVGQVAGGRVPAAAVTLVPAAEVGQVRPENVLLSVDGAAGQPGTYGLHLDLDHPGYFEHACDHVPGMALVEAFRQAGHRLIHQTGGAGATAPARPHLLAASAVAFDSFGELHVPVAISAQEGPLDDESGARLVRLAAVQGGRTVARATSVYRPHHFDRAG
ncbi:ScbA/BarX family gamma-butyrolactone biosynthesis protein [Streptomyces sp. NPDC058255]|uniref:ScbA/BarX family gamma-butyrolactone biosynthesis protein n=1 Tax=Streptomyces sp. NPDC058255 TaxID=3346407 RepID=UPI0036EF3C5B